MNNELLYNTIIVILVIIILLLLNFNIDYERKFKILQNN